MVLYTTRPSQDGAVLAAAERALRSDLERTGWTRSRVGIEVRVYPDAEGFRDATGEPGWVAAYAHGARIEMQPVRDAEKTLRHEFFHVLVESQAEAFPTPLVPRGAGGLFDCGSGAHDSRADSLRCRTCGRRTTPLARDVPMRRRPRRLPNWAVIMVRPPCCAG